MILIIGGAYQGKLEYIKNNYDLKDIDIVNGEDCSIETAEKGVCLYNYHKLIERLLFNNKNIDDYIENLNYSIIISNEIGNSIIPINKDERLLVEKVGRSLCSIAKKAEKVIRIHCGLPIIIKG